MLNFGVIGFEHGHIHSIIEGLVDHGQFALKAIADYPTGKFAEAKEKYDVPAYEDYRRMLDKESIDVVAMTPLNNQKAGVIVECASRGVHMFSDKPFWASLEDQEKAEKALRPGSAKLHGYLSMRFSALHHHMKRAVDEGRIGEIVSCIFSVPHGLKPQKRDKAVLDASINGGLIVDIAIHAIDMARWLTASEPEEVAAYTSNRRFTQFEDFEDNAQILMKMESGAAAFIEADWLTPDGGGHRGICRATGTEGSVFLDRSECVVVTSYDAPPDVRRITPADSPEISNFDDFYRYITQDGYEPVLSTEDIIRDMKIALEARQQALKRR